MCKSDGPVRLVPRPAGWNPDRGVQPTDKADAPDSLVGTTAADKKDISASKPGS